MKKAKNEKTIELNKIEVHEKKKRSESPLSIERLSESNDSYDLLTASFKLASLIIESKEGVIASTIRGNTARASKRFLFAKWNDEQLKKSGLIALYVKCMENIKKHEYSTAVESFYDTFRKTAIKIKLPKKHKKIDFTNLDKLANL